MTAPVSDENFETSFKTITNAFETITNDYIANKTITRITFGGLNSVAILFLTREMSRSN